MPQPDCPFVQMEHFNLSAAIIGEHSKANAAGQRTPQIPSPRHVVTLKTSDKSPTPHGIGRSRIAPCANSTRRK